MIKLPTIDSSLEIGIGNLSTGEVKSSSNFVYFNCSSNIDCCSNMDIPVTENEIESIMKHDYHMDQIIDNPSPIINNKKGGCASLTHNNQHTHNEYKNFKNGRSV